jgi:hypothetical protein
MIIIDGVVTGAITGAILSGIGGTVLKLNSTAPTDIKAGLLYGTTGGVIGGALGDVLTANSKAGIIVGATIGTVGGLTVLILKELSNVPGV